MLNVNQLMIYAIVHGRIKVYYLDQCNAYIVKSIEIVKHLNKSMRTLRMPNIVYFTVFLLLFPRRID